MKCLNLSAWQDNPMMKYNISPGDFLNKAAPCYT